MNAQASLEVLVSLVLAMLFAFAAIAVIASANGSAAAGLGSLKGYATAAAQAANRTELLCGCVPIG